ncbi:unknown [Bacteroides faecis CAG:32]|nr:unknown [Bacteroides faecis CAG:32]
MAALGHQINKSILTYPLLPSVYRCIGFQPSQDFFQQSRILSTCRTALTFIQIQNKKIILNSKLPKFTRLYRHYHQGFVATLVFKFRPCLSCGFVSGIILHRISCLLVIFFITNIHYNRVIHMRCHRSYHSTFRITLDIRQHISVKHTFQLNSYSFRRSIIITCQFQTTLHSLFMNTHIFERLLR